MRRTVMLTGLLLLVATFVPEGCVASDDDELIVEDVNETESRRSNKRKTEAFEREEQRFAKASGEFAKPSDGAPQTKQERAQEIMNEGRGNETRNKAEGNRTRHSEWNTKSPNPGWDTWYKGKCEEVISCTQAGDLDCLKKRAVPLCNLQLQQEGGTAPWKKALAVAIEYSHLDVVIYYIEHEMKWWKLEDEITSYNGTALLHAAASGEPLIAKYLLWKGADIRKRTKHDESAFDLARVSAAPEDTLKVLNEFADKTTAEFFRALTDMGSSFYTTEEVERFLRGGASLTALEPKLGLPLLAIAAKQGMSDVMNQLIANGADMNWRDPRTGHAIVHMACDRGHFTATRVLVEAFADVSATTAQFEMNCLHLAAWNGRNGIAGLLLQLSNVDVNAKTADGDTALLLHLKQQYGQGLNSPLVAALLEKQADPAVRDAKKRTAVYYAVSHNQLEPTRALIKHGADCGNVAWVPDPENKQDRGVGCFEQSIKSGSKEVALFLVQQDSTALRGAPLHMDGFQYFRTGRGVQATPLYAVAMQGWENVLSVMLANGAKPDTRNRGGGDTALMAAAASSESMVLALVGAGATVDLTNRFGETALFAAAFNGRLESVRHLLEAGANVNHKDKQQTTALFRAAKNGHLSVVKFLLAEGADKAQSGFYQPTKGQQANVATSESAAQCARRHGHLETADFIDAWTGR